MGYPRQPDVVLGDLDSLHEQARKAYHDRLVVLPSQQSSDLEKALVWAAEAGVTDITILGATGLRDDHTFGNLLMLWSDFGLGLTLLTDFGAFTVVRTDREFASFEGQPVALFPENSTIRITTTGLAFDLDDQALPALHKGTSNSSRGASFSLQIAGGPVVVFQGYTAQEPTND